MIPAWLFTLPLDQIANAADRYHLDREFVAAVVMAESTGERCTTRYEKKFRWVVSPKEWARRLGVTRATELYNQKCSWGLMHIMGGTARDEGFNGHMPELCDVPVGLDYGCKYLRKQMDRWGPDPERVYAAYNGGSPRRSLLTGKYRNQKQVDRFMRFYRQLTGVR